MRVLNQPKVSKASKGGIVLAFSKEAALEGALACMATYDA
jgi:hypothetical protein